MKSRILRLFRLAFTVPLALPIVLVIRAIRPFLLVRIGALKSDRIGHFVLETELMLHEQRLGIQPVPPRSFDVYYVPTPISNSQIERMWQRELRVLPRWIMVPVNRLNRDISGGGLHVVPSASSTCLDVHNILDSTPPILHFTSDEEEKGRQLLEDMGLERGRYVCVIVRDAAYYKRALPAQDLSYHDYRNCDVDTYVEAMEAIANRGLHVLRMGALVEKPVNSSHPRVIDYANSRFRSEFADIYLGANCKFCVSDGLGYYTVPAAFRRPNAYVNYSPFHMLYSSRACDLGIAKVFVDKQSGEILPLRELVGRGVASLTRTELIAGAGLAVKDNTPAEIRDLMIEMNDRIDGTWVSSDQDEELQRQFWRMFRKVIGEDGLKIHGEFRARFGANYLRNHVDWFTE